MAKQRLLSVQNLKVHREGKPILQDISVEVSEGDTIAIIGPNGAGKSTLFKTLMGLVPVAGGEIDLLGKPLKHYSNRQRAQIIAYVPQAPEHGMGCSVEDFILMGRYPYLSSFSQPGPNDRRIMEESFVLSGTSALRHRIMDSLSGGERQKVMLAGCLAQQPKIMLLDEPASYLDPRNELEIQALLQRINQETGMAMVTVSHHLNSILRYSKTIVGIKEGQLRFCGTPEQLLRSDALTQIYETHFQQIPAPDGGLPVLIPERVAGL